MTSWWTSEGIVLGAKDGTAFTGDQRLMFGLDPQKDDYEIVDKEKKEKAIANVRNIRKRITEDKMQVLSIDDFKKRKLDPTTIVHLKGFGHEVEDKCDEEILKTLSKYQVLVWDGDEYDCTGFTRMVPKFLDANPKGECVAFKIDYEIDIFRESWAEKIERYPGRITLVSTDLKFPTLEDAKKLGVIEEMASASELSEGGKESWAQEYFVLGRVACHVTQSRSVICLGGGGITRHEGKVGIAKGAKWEVFNLRRKGNPTYHTVDADGWRDEKGNALMDWVRSLEKDTSMKIDTENDGLKYCLQASEDCLKAREEYCCSLL